MVPAPVLSTDVESVGPGLNVVTARGEIDLAHAEQFEHDLRAAVKEQGTVNLIVDLTEVTFIDSSGANALVRVLEQQRKASGELVIVTNDRRVTTLLEVSRLDRVLRRFDTCDAAVDALAPNWIRRMR